jgi:hypothetical protein
MKLKLNRALLHAAGCMLLLLCVCVVHLHRVFAAFDVDSTGTVDLLKFVKVCTQPLPYSCV